MTSRLSARRQALLLRAEQERAAAVRAATALQQPARWLDKVLPWLLWGYRLTRRGTGTPHKR
jgi:hypothetical protein